MYILIVIICIGTDFLRIFCKTSKNGFQVGRQLLRQGPMLKNSFEIILT